MILRIVFFVLAFIPGLAFSACVENSVSLRGTWGQANFTVEVADDAQERGVGLMHRRSLPMSAGMLFVYDTPQPVSFWMKNTLIPLDMLFFDQSGVLRRIHDSATPEDLTPIPGGTDIQFVLEINGGLARRLGMTEGSELRHVSVQKEFAAWACSAS